MHARGCQVAKSPRKFFIFRTLLFNPVIQKEFLLFLNYHTIFKHQIWSSILPCSDRCCCCLKRQSCRNTVSYFFMKNEQFYSKIDCTESRNLWVRIQNSTRCASTTYYHSLASLSLCLNFTLIGKLVPKLFLLIEGPPTLITWLGKHNWNPSSGEYPKRFGDTPPLER